MMSCWLLLNNEVNQQYVSIYSLPVGPTPCPYPSTITVISVLTEHRAELPILYSSFPLVIYFTHGRAHTSISVSQFIPTPSPPSMSTHPFSLSASLFLPCK